MKITAIWQDGYTRELDPVYGLCSIRHKEWRPIDLIADDELKGSGLWHEHKEYWHKQIVDCLSGKVDAEAIAKREVYGE